ncbi:hypothetical protein NN561_007206 [Cricetulus griseus]
MVAVIRIKKAISMAQLQAIASPGLLREHRPGSHPNCCRFTPGTFLHYPDPSSLRGPRLRLRVVADPRAGHQLLTEAALSTCPRCNRRSSALSGHYHPVPKEIGKEEIGKQLAAAEKAVTMRSSREWAAPAPEVIDAQPKGVQVPSTPIQQSPAEDRSAQPATEDWSAAPTVKATEWVGVTIEWP